MTVAQLSHPTSTTVSNVSRNIMQKKIGNDVQNNMIDKYIVKKIECTSVDVKILEGSEFRFQRKQCELFWILFNFN